MDIGSKKDIASGGESVKNISSIASEIEKLGSSKNIERGTENLGRLGRALQDFAKLDVSKLEKTTNNTDKISETISKFSEILSNKKFENFQPRSAMLGVGISNISNGLNVFSNLKIGSLKKNISEISSLPNLIDDLIYSLSGNTKYTDRFEADSLSIGRSISIISEGISEFGKIDLKNVKKNADLIKGLGDHFIDDLIFSLSGNVKYTDRFEADSKSLGPAFSEISRGIAEFAKIDIKNLKKNYSQIILLPNLVDDLMYTLGSLQTKDFTDRFETDSISIGRGFYSISQGIAEFAKIDIKTLRKNYSQILTLPNLIDDLMYTLGSLQTKEYTDRFEKDSKSIGPSILEISRGIGEFAKLDISKLRQNLELISGLNIVDTIIESFNPSELPKTFKKAGLAFGQPLFEMSKGLKAFSEISFYGLIKNALLLAIFGRNILKGLKYFPQITISKKLAESFTNIGTISDGLRKFSDLKFGSLIKNAILLKLFGGLIVSSFKSLKTGIKLKEVAENFAKPLEAIASALIKFSEIKWGKVIFSALMFKVFKGIFGGKGLAMAGIGGGGGKQAGGSYKNDPFYKLGFMQLSELYGLHNVALEFFNWWTDGDMKREQNQERLLDALEALDLEVSGGGDKKGSEKDPIKENKKSWWSKIGDFLKGFLPNILGALAFIPGVIIGFFSTIGKLLKESFIGRTLGKVFGAIGKVFKPITGFIGSALDEVADVFSGIPKFFRKISAPLKKLFSFGDEGLSIFKSFFSKLASSAKFFFKIGKVFGSLLGKLALPVQIVMSVIDGVKGFIDGFKEEGILGGIKGALVGVIDGLLGIFIDYPAKFFGWIAGKLGFENVAEVLKNFSFKDNLMGMVDSLFDTLEEYFTNLFSGDFSTILSTLFPVAGVFKLLLPDSVQQKISEFFQEMVRGLLPNPQDSFVGKMLSKAIPDSVYEWAGMNPKTGALLPKNKLDEFLAAQGDPSKTGKDIREMRKSLKEAGYTDEMIDKAADEKAKMELAAREKAYKLEQRAKAREKEIKIEDQAQLDLVSQAEEDYRFANPDLLPPDVTPVGQAMDVISTSNEDAKQESLASVIAPVKNNNVTNNNSSSSTTVINSNIPDRTFGRFGMHGGHSVHAW